MTERERQLDTFDRIVQATEQQVKLQEATLQEIKKRTEAHTRFDALEKDQNLIKQDQQQLFKKHRIHRRLNGVLLGVIFYLLSQMDGLWPGAGKIITFLLEFF